MAASARFTEREGREPGPRRKLAEAREKAAALRKRAKARSNPVAERDRERVPIPTFAEALEEAHKALGSGWADKTAKAFKTSLEEHALPKLG